MDTTIAAFLAPVVVPCSAGTCRLIPASFPVLRPAHLARRTRRPALARRIANPEQPDPVTTPAPSSPPHNTHHHHHNNIDGNNLPRNHAILPKLLLAALAATATAVVVTNVSSGGVFIERLQEFATWIDSLGPSGRIAYAFAYFALELIAVPAAPLTLAAGFLFGPVVGSALVSVASTAAAATAFLIARYALRSYIIERAQSFPAFRTVDRAIALEGFKNVLLLRLSPLFPFSISNYLYGLTAVSFLPYTIASWIGMLPGTIAYVYAGTAFTNLADIGGPATPHVNPALPVLGLVATVLFLKRLGEVAGEAVKADVNDD